MCFDSLLLHFAILLKGISIPCPSVKDARVYLYTLINGHKYCKRLSKLIKLTLQKELQNFVTNNVFFGQYVKSQQNNKSNIKTLAGAGN